MKSNEGFSDLSPREKRRRIKQQVDEVMCRVPRPSRRLPEPPGLMSKLVEVADAQRAALPADEVDRRLEELSGGVPEVGKSAARAKFPGEVSFGDDATLYSRFVGDRTLRHELSHLVAWGENGVPGELVITYGRTPEGHTVRFPSAIPHFPDAMPLRRRLEVQIDAIEAAPDKSPSDRRNLKGLKKKLKEM